MIVSDYIFDFLIKKGVDTAFIVTGGQAMFLNDALAKRKEIKPILLIMNKLAVCLRMLIQELQIN